MMLDAIAKLLLRQDLYQLNWGEVNGAAGSSSRFYSIHRGRASIAGLVTRTDDRVPMEARSAK